MVLEEASYRPEDDVEGEEVSSRLKVGVGGRISSREVSAVKRFCAVNCISVSPPVN